MKQSLQEGLKKVRQVHGITKRTLAKRIGVSTVTLWRWEQGQPISRAHRELLGFKFPGEFGEERR